jgi:phosphoribosylamine---glycine ligase
MNVQGDPYLIEYNCRLGDPETEVVLPRLKNDLVELILNMHEGTLSHITVQPDELAACTVMLVSAGYPGSYEKGQAITGVANTQGGIVFHAGTTMKDQVLRTNGGRVLAVTAYGATLQDAVTKSYQIASTIHFADKYYRKDIGYEFI